MENVPSPQAKRGGPKKHDEVLGLPSESADLFQGNFSIESGPTTSLPRLHLGIAKIAIQSQHVWIAKGAILQCTSDSAPGLSRWSTNLPWAFAS